MKFYRRTCRRPTRLDCRRSLEGGHLHDIGLRRDYDCYRRCRAKAPLVPELAATPERGDAPDYPVHLEVVTSSAAASPLVFSGARQNRNAVGRTDDDKNEN